MRWLLMLLSIAIPLPVNGVDLSRLNVVDLSHAYNEQTLYWPTSPSGFELEILSSGETEGGWYYSANAFCTPEHGGTHLDAPVHFSRGGLSVEAIPLERLMGPAAVIDVSEKVDADQDYRLTTADVLRWEAANGRVPAGAVVVLRTGWSRFWPDAKHYLGDDTLGDASNLHFPSYGAEAARFLIEARGIEALAVDTASIDFGRSTDFLVHRIAADANVTGLENLTNVRGLPPTGAWIIALPVKITGGSGAPARVIALLP